MSRAVRDHPSHPPALTCPCRSDLFRTRWAGHDVHLHRGGVKHLRHPVVDELTLEYDALDLLAGRAASFDENDSPDVGTRPISAPGPGTSA